MSSEEAYYPVSLDPINLLVGQCIQAFALVETALGMIFATMMAPADRLRSVTVFHSIRTFEGKLTTLDELARIAVSASDRPKYDGLMKRVRSLQKTRNKLAHWNASLWPGASTVEEIKKMRPALVPPIWSKEAMETLWGDRQPITEKQLRATVGQANKLITDLFQYDASKNPDVGGQTAY